MGRFASTAATYWRYRQPYGDIFFRDLAHILQLNQEDTLIDLGCGPANLSIGFSPYVGQIIAVDPEPEMIKAAKRQIGQTYKNIELVQSTTEDLITSDIRATVAVFGRSIHWMDSAKTISVLNRILVNRGHAIICEASTEGSEPTQFIKTFDEVVEKWADIPYSEMQEREDTYFSNSNFTLLNTYEYNYLSNVSINDLVARALTFSTTSYQQLGERTIGFINDLRSALSPHFMDTKTHKEIVRVSARIYG